MYLVSLVLNEAGAKDYQGFGVPPDKDKQFSLTEQDRADGYRKAI